MSEFSRRLQGQIDEEARLQREAAEREERSRHVVEFARGLSEVLIERGHPFDRELVDHEKGLRVNAWDLRFMPSSYTPDVRSPIVKTIDTSASDNLGEDGNLYLNRHRSDGTPELSIMPEYFYDQAEQWLLSLAAEARVQPQDLEERGL